MEKGIYYSRVFRFTPFGSSMNNSNNIVRIIACDPGLMNFGYVLIEYDLQTNHKHIVRHETLKGSNLLKAQKELQLQFRNRHIILWELEPVLIDLIREEKPHYIVSEDAFMYAFADTFAALTMVIQTLRTASKIVTGKDIYLVAPRESKKAISSHGEASKDSVQEAVLADPTITIKSNKQNPVEKITEHVYDAIAHGVAFIRNHLPSVQASEKING